MSTAIIAALGAILAALIGSGVAIFLVRANRDNIMADTASDLAASVRSEMKNLTESLKEARELTRSQGERIAVLESDLRRTEEATALALKVASEATAEALRVTSSATAEALVVSTEAAKSAADRLAELRAEISDLRSGASS